jgi:N-sulfoglucosamine sulfohydrolase
MYGLYGGTHHFSSFDGVKSLPLILNKTGGDFWYGIVGKKHVGPDSVYPFPFSYTGAHYDLNQVARNITRMKEIVSEFFSLAKSKGKPFFLYIASHDPHRGTEAQKRIYGQFLERWGDGSPGMGLIPDWNPVDYSPDDVKVPYYFPDTNATRSDLAALYRTVSRYDQGIGIFMQLLKDFGYDDNTLVFLTSDNGIPFPNAKTNLYDPGMGEPLLISNPLAKQRWNSTTQAFASHTDFVPTILDWFDLPVPTYNMNGHKVMLHGTSLLPVTEKEPSSGYDKAFSSHNLHEVTMYYPMRVLRNKQYKLIHNLNYKMAYPIASDIYFSPSFRDIVNRSIAGLSVPWFKTLQEYYYRDEWELFDLESDPKELNNLAPDSTYGPTLKAMQEELLQWQVDTNDIWRCGPSSLLDYDETECFPLDNRQ